MALLVSPLGIVDVAGHQIALNFSSLMFVLPMSLAAAVTIRVGYRLGQGSTLDAQTAARTGLMVGVCMATLTAIFTVSLREQIALLYNDNPEVVTLAAHLMLLAAVYQISDSIQVIGSGICVVIKIRVPFSISPLRLTGCWACQAAIFWH